MKNPILVAAVLAITSTAAMAEGKPGGHFIENWDLNADGVVSIDDLTERRTDIFTTFDANEDDLIDAAEYLDFDAARAADMAENAGGEGHGKGPMKKIQDAMSLAFNDTNKDGQVSKQEFMDATAAMLEMADRNGDGVISGDDFGKR